MPRVQDRLGPGQMRNCTDTKGAISKRWKRSERRK